ncbi:hypothetical protein IGI04_016645, partial [Brassica rapa subsp. trilocularis]
MDSTKKTEEIAAQEKMHLPWELIEEILSRVSPISLVRFKTVCKRWNAILDDKTFINNHKETFRFILKSKSKIYSVSIDPKIVVRELTLDVPGLESQKPKFWIDYDNNWTSIWGNYKVWIIHDYAFVAWKHVTSGDCDERKIQLKTMHSEIGGSLNGSLFWIAYRDETDPLYCLCRFDFYKERFYRFCDLPCGMTHPRDALVVRFFKGDRFSVLKQCHVTKKIEIWVTNNKVDVEDGRDVVWVSFMTFSIPNFPSLVQAEPYSHQQPSYYIDDKRLVMCSCDENGQAWIYVLGENKLISIVQLDSVVDPWPSHCTYFPSLVP